MNMGRKKSKRSTKNTTRKNVSDTSSGNAASAANIEGGSSRSTSGNVASSDAVRSISSPSTSRYASNLNPDNEHVTIHTVFGSTVTETTFPRNSAAIGRPKARNRLSHSTSKNPTSDRSSQSNQRVSSQTLRNSTSVCSVNCVSSQSTISNISTVDLENQSGSSGMVSRKAAARGTLQSTTRGTTSAGAARGGPSQSSRSAASSGTIQGRSLQSEARGTSSARASKVKSTTRNTVSAEVHADGRSRTVETDSRRSTFVDNADVQRRISLPVTRNFTSLTRPLNSQTTQSNANNVERRDPILYPIFFIIRNVDGSEVYTLEIEHILGRFNCITLLRNGSILVKTKSQSESNILLNLKTIRNKPVSVVPHGSLNSSQGTIFCKSLNMCSVEEILDHLRPQHVTKVYRFRKRINGTLVDTPRLLLTFDTPQPPKQIKAGFLWLEVRLFSPTPRRCFNCQSFKHTSKYCRSPPVCPLCGETGHTYPPRCNNPIRCVNCEEDGHTATSSECYTFKLEKKVLEFHALTKVGIAEARLRIANKIYSGKLKI